MMLCTLISILLHPFILALAPESAQEEDKSQRHTQEFKFVKKDGEPFVNATVFLSRVHIPLDALPTRTAKPGSPTKFDAVFSARTDSSGLLRIHGLKAGSYTVRMTMPRPFGVNRSPIRSGRIVVPSPRIQCVVKPMWAAVLKVSGDKVLTSGSGFSSTSFRNSGLRQTRQVTDDLRRKWKNAIVYVAFARRVGKPTAQYKILLERTGWKTGSLAFKPLDQLGEPTCLQITPQTPSIESGSLQILRGKDAAKVGMPDLLLSDSQLPAPYLIMSIEYGRKYKLAPGTYYLYAREHALHKVLGYTTLELIKGKTLTYNFVLPKNVAQCKLDITDETGKPCEEAQVVFKRDETVVWSSRWIRGSIVWAYLPFAELEAHVTVQGCKRVEKLIHVTTDKKDHRFHFRMRWDR